MLKQLFLLVPLLLVLPVASAQLITGNAVNPFEDAGPGLQPEQEISNPEAVSYLHAEVTRSGYVYLSDSSPFQKASELTVTLTVPQNTTRQKSQIKSVIGPDRYYIGEDAWGNKVARLYWEIPDLKKKLYYTLVSDVEVSDGAEAAGNVKFPMTGFTEATPAIAQLTFDLTYGLDDIQRFFALSEWVHKNTIYDNDAKAFSESAAWTFQNRKGACDEFSNLLLSMLRVLGYEPRYVVGYAYSEDWGQHGWVEADYRGKTVSLDPTWLESPVDSTHIKVAELPDSNLTEHVEARGGQITIDWKKDEPLINVISHTESPKITIGASLIPENTTGESYSLLSTDFVPVPECILSNIRVKSCTMQSQESFLSVQKDTQTLAICGPQKLYWFLKTPQTESGVLYACPVIIYGAGAEKSVTVTAGPGPGSRMSTSVKSQSVFTPGQIFEMESVTENQGFVEGSVTAYVFFGGSVQSRDFTIRPGESASTTWIMKAPQAPGDYELTLFSSSGEMASRSIKVIQQRHAQIQNISSPSRASAGEVLSVNITVRGISDFSGIMNITIDGYSETRGVFLGPSESKTFLISHTPQSPGTRMISVTVFSDSRQYEDGWWGTLEVTGQRQWWDELLDWLEGVVGSVLSALGIG
jgi:hypothetical protein